MAIKVARGGILDILFTLKDRENGNLTNPDTFGSGLDGSKWPSAAFKTLAGATVTSSWVKDITADSVVAPKIKHPDPTTGLIHDGTVGLFRVRVQPQVGLALGDYELHVTFTVNGAVYTEPYTLTLVASGDVVVGGDPYYCSEDDVLANFELETIVTTNEVTKARQRADKMVNSFLMKDAITPIPYTTIIDPLNLAAVAFARAELRRLKSAVMGPGLGVSRIKEGDTEFQFQSGDKQFAALYDEGVEWMSVAISAILGGGFYFAATSKSPRTD